MMVTTAQALARVRALGATTLLASAIFISGNSQAGQLDISDVPLFLQDSVPPLNMLVVGRDHKLYTAAYNDASDLNGDGKLDIGYRGYLSKEAGGIDYYGYFDSYKCYTYGSSLFSPSRKTADKTCGGSGEWSGDFLNYVTTARVDALRKVLYGGYRSTDSTTQTILERSYIPQDAHSWGKEYKSATRDGYNIRLYAPFDAPSTGYILFANTTLSSTLNSGNYRNPNGAPLMRVRREASHRIWEWVAKDAPVAGSSCVVGNNHSASCNGTLTDYVVRVEVCKSPLQETNCNPKPTGLLHDYQSSMAFGLLTGSYMHNKQGGVVRKELAMFSDELRNDGRFTSPKKGILASLDGIKIQDYDGSGNYNHNWNCTAGWDSEIQPDGRCRVWSNPLGEMMMETLRYFAGASSSTGAYDYSNSGSDDSLLGMPQVTSWKNPYGSEASGGLGYPKCSKPFQTIISDVNPSYDSELPGSAWGGAPSFSLPSKISSVNVGTLGQEMWNHEFNGASKEIYIGQVGGTADGAPTPKTASSFGNIRGLSPEEPTKQGTYYSSAMAFFGNKTDINAADGDQQLQTFAVALSSPLPRIEMPVNGKIISLVPFGKVVRGPSGITSTWQPTNQIAAFFIESIVNLPGQQQDASVNGGRPYAVFRVNFEDAEQGNDFDMDVIVRYTVQVTADDQLSVRVRTEYAKAGHESHLGYVISGTSDGRDGIYLDVSGGGSQSARHPMDTPSTVWAGGCQSGCGTYTLPGLADGESVSDNSNNGPERLFSPDSVGGSAEFLRNPLWYAAKYGGFVDKNGNSLPDNASGDVKSEWDANGDGNPDNYFLVTNALTLGDQLRQAFQRILESAGSASSASVNSGSISSDTRVYQATFNYDNANWTGELTAFKVDTQTGALLDKDSPDWEASEKLPAFNSRVIITTNTNGDGVPFRWDDTDLLDDARKAAIDPDFATDSELAKKRIAYLRGDDSNEVSKGGIFRNRPSKLGDIVSSSPLYVGVPPFFYRDNLESKPYSKFKLDRIGTDTNGDGKPDQGMRPAMVYTGANDGMLHAFDASSGTETLAFIPSAAYRNLSSLSDPAYEHKFFVDAPPNMGDVFYDNGWHTVLVGGMNSGGQEIYALDITDPSDFSESKASSLVLWEFTDADDADMGYSYSQPAIVRLQNGKWAAIFGNGYNNTAPDGIVSSTGQAVIYIVDIETGSIIKKLETKQGTAQDPFNDGRPNGMSTPAVVDYNGDSKVDYIYAGDMFGNLWKFDIRSSNKDDWKTAYGTEAAPVPLFKAIDPQRSTVRQPITSRPEVIRGPQGVGFVVLFGTGKYIETSDKIVDTADKYIQAYYGLRDRNSGNAATDVITGLAQLTKQTILAEGSYDFTDSENNTITRKLRITSQNDFEAAKKGWYLNLLSPPNETVYRGERQVSNTAVRAGRVIFTTLIPNADACGSGGDSWLMELDAINGGRLAATPFDMNNDGVFDDKDLVEITINGETVKVAASGMDLGVGITPEPGILLGEGGTKEYKYNPGTTGEIGVTVENPGPRSSGRQSWRQIR